MRSSELPSDQVQPPLLLDTTVLTYLTDPRNRHPEWDEIVHGRTLVLSFVTVGEILHATMTTGWKAARIADVEARLRAYPVIPGTIGVSRKYAELRRWYWNQIGENDLWIAACALSQTERVELATADGDYALIAERFPLNVVGP